MPKPNRNQTKPTVTDAATDVVTPAAPKPAVPRNTYHGYASQFTPPGTNKQGVEKTHVVQRIHQVKYGLTPHKLRALSERFPGLLFVTDGFLSHDHPVAHISYQIVWDIVLDQLPPGAVCADVCGNPALNEKYTRAHKNSTHCPTIDNYCSVMSPKDALRAALRWGPKLAKDGTTRWEDVTLYDMYRNEENLKKFAKYDQFLMHHVIYYYTPAEINKLLHIKPGSILTATLHKLPGSSGFINDGEQEYKKDPLTGKVKMWNVDTMESYEHSDPAFWFSKYCYADEAGAFAWTMSKGCDDTYILKATSCNPALVEQQYWRDQRIVLPGAGELLPAEPIPASPPPAYPQQEVVIDGSVLVPGRVGRTKRVRITHPELYKELQTFMINRPRNGRTLQDLTSKAHREVGNNMLIGGSKKKVDIDPTDLANHIAAAFAANMALEKELYQAALPQYSDVLGSNRGVVKNGLKVLAFTKATLSNRDPVMHVLKALDELF